MTPSTRRDAHLLLVVIAATACAPRAEVHPEPVLASSSTSLFTAPPERATPPAGPTCGQLERAITADLSLRACTNDGDCTTGARYCGCSQPISTLAKTRLGDDEAVWLARGCADVGPRQACARCASPPTVDCLGGFCSAKP